MGGLVLGYGIIKGCLAIARATYEVVGVYSMGVLF
jgi:hypothetical protein